MNNIIFLVIELRINWYSWINCGDYSIFLIIVVLCNNISEDMNNKLQRTLNYAVRFVSQQATVMFNVTACRMWNILPTDLVK
ncbi:uncharacterized protein LOC142319796 [Lycorma delicatula]|uniref:uncharacterized protein LOC142319796 n=1 Tax=Lycorma delicatula TaxID=130591 RepID=UPI003F512A8D